MIKYRFLQYVWSIITIDRLQEEIDGLLFQIVMAINLLGSCFQ